MEFFNSQYSLIRIRPLGFDWQYVSIGSGVDLVPNQQQTISWANANQNGWCYVASLSRYELKLNNLALESVHKNPSWIKDGKMAACMYPRN